MNFFKKGRILFVIVTLIAIMVSGCASQQPPSNTQENKGNETGISSEKYPMKITDGAGNELTIEHKPERIVSLAPSHTEILYGLGLEDKIVGVTTYCDYPEEAKEKPKVGDSFTINMEKIIELQPDIVINYWPVDEAIKNQLNEAGIAVLTYSPESIAQVKETIEKIGAVTDTEDTAKKITNDITAKENEIANIVKDASKPKVFYEIEYSSALWTAGEGSFIDELITLGGGENIAKDAQGSYAQYSVESLIEKDPEIYVTNTFNMQVKGSSDIKSRPGFEDINAIKNDRVEILDGNMLSRPSQRVSQALELMAKAIHPELFK